MGRCELCRPLPDEGVHPVAESALLCPARQTVIQMFVQPVELPGEADHGEVDLVLGGDGRHFGLGRYRVVK